MSTYGPQLPPGFRTTVDKDAECSKSNITGRDCVQDLYGPALPPDMMGPVMPSSSKSFIGPIMPPGLNKKTACDDDSDDDDDDEEEGGSLIGPSLSEAVGKDHVDDVAAEVERRAMKMRRRIEGKDECEAERKRETWMTELPDNLGLRIGLEARTFLKRGVQADADRSAWTDTPSDRARKAAERASKKRVEGPPLITDRELERNRELSRQVEEYNRERRPQSLFEMHRKKKTAEKKTERREFDRDEDLKIRRIDPRKAKSLANDAAFLRSKFAAALFWLAEASFFYRQQRSAVFRRTGRSRRGMHADSRTT